jgi:hypothetical protein
MRPYINIFSLLLLISIFIAGCKKTPENNPPVITSVTLNPKAVTPGSSILIQVKATDNDGDLIMYSYFPSAGIIAGTGANVSWLAPDTTGIYSLIIRASDDKGGVSTDSVTLVVSEFVTPTQILGKAIFSNGTQGDLSYSRVALYASLADRTADIPQKIAITKLGSFSIVNFEMDSITPGDYFLDVWKDNDNSETYSNGDFLGWYGSGDLLNPHLNKIHIVQGQTTEVIVQMYIY